MVTRKSILLKKNVYWLLRSTCIAGDQLLRTATMGLLSEGSPLSWEETKKYAQHVRHHGILQFINQFNKLKDRSNDCLRWGDEVGLPVYIDCSYIIAHCACVLSAFVFSLLAKLYLTLRYLKVVLIAGFL